MILGRVILVQKYTHTKFSCLLGMYDIVVRTNAKGTKINPVQVVGHATLLTTPCLRVIEDPAKQAITSVQDGHSCLGFNRVSTEPILPFFLCVWSCELCV